MVDGLINGVVATLQLRQKEDRAVPGGGLDLREDDFRDVGRPRARRAERRHNYMAHIRPAS